MSKTTTLAAGQITAADQISIELVQASETPTVILIRWPDAPSVTDPRRFAATANAVMAVLAAASARLAEIKAAQPWSPG
jgi:hypothetical protein